ncbi:putative major intrinsic protein [Helianthus anomalus]
MYEYVRGMQDHKNVGKLTTDAALDPAGLVAIATAHALALFVGVSMAANISGGHLNPAVTFGLAIGGNITIITGLFTGLPNVSVPLLPAFSSNLSPVVPTHGVADGMNGVQGAGSLGTIAPIAIGFIVGANILAAGPFSGGPMNPARSFGPAVVSGDFSQNWIYWAGPLIGGGLAGVIIRDVFIGSYQTLPPSEDYA